MGLNTVLRQARPVPKRLILLAFIVVCLGLLSLVGWVLWGVPPPKGLPRGLIGKQRQLVELSLPRSVDRLDWVGDHIEVLNASGTKIRSLRGLPASLQKLDVSYTSIQSLESVPRDLKALDIRATRIEHLAGLPLHLESLKVANRKIFRLGRLPDSLQELHLENTGISELTGLPPHLRELYLEGENVENLDDLPETLQSLTLVATKVKSLKNLPPSLQILKLVANHDLRFQGRDLPPLLTRLEMDVEYTDLKNTPDFSDLKYLSWFSDRRSSYLDFRDWKKNPSPRFRSSLSSLTLWVPDRPFLPRPFLPRPLRALGLLNATITMGISEKLPPELEVLDLTGYSNPELESLRKIASLKRLEIRYSSISKLPEFPEHLDSLILTGSKITDLRGLPQALKALIFCDSGLEHLDGEQELPHSLEWLDVCNSRSLKSLSSVHAGLVYLNLGGTGISVLPKLPDSLRELDVSNTKIKRLNLHELPRKLRALTLSEGQVENLDGLPRSVKVLRFVSRIDID